MEEAKTAAKVSTRNAAQCRASRARWCLPAERGMDRLRSRIHSSLALAELLTGGRTFRSDNRSWSGEGLLSPEASGAEAHKSWHWQHVGAEAPTP